MRIQNPTAWDQMILDRAKVESLAPHADKVYIVEQNNGYEHVVVLHMGPQILIYQRFAQMAALDEAVAGVLARDMRELSGSVENAFRQHGQSILTVQGTREGNAGDWTLCMSPLPHNKKIKGSYNLPELADALMGL